MPSIYDFRHVELDKVGRGKRIIKAPGGGSHNIFGQSDSQQPVNGNGKPMNGSNGCSSISETESVDGSILSCPSTPVHNGNGFGYESDTSSVSSATSSRRGSLQDTKNRLFGQADQMESPRRRVVDRMKSNIFAEPEPSPVMRTPSVKKYEHVIRRNPITGEILADSAPPSTPPNGAANGGSNGTNGTSSAAHAAAAIIAANINGNGTMNGGSNGTASMPNTPVRVRQPPGGKTSNIFG